MVRPTITAEQRIERRANILEFFRAHQFSGKTAMYSNGIPRCPTTDELFDQLVSENEIVLIHTRNGEPRYYIPIDWNPSHEHNQSFPLLKYYCQEVMFQLLSFAQTHQEFNELAQIFCDLLEQRYKICITEIKNLHEPNTKLLEKDIASLESFLFVNGHFLDLPRWGDSYNVQGIAFQNQSIEEFTAYINVLLDFTTFFLNNQAHAYGSRKNKFRNIITGQRQIIHRKLQMRFSEDHRRWGIKERDFANAIEPITADDITNYDEVITRLGVERQSILTKNPEFAVYSHMLMMINQDLENLRRDNIDEDTYLFLNRWWHTILKIAAIRMENRTYRNYDTEVIIHLPDNEDTEITCEFLNDSSNLTEDELERKKDIISVILMTEFQE